MQHGWWYDFAHDFAGPAATALAAVVAAGITLYFNRIQARIANEQARIANFQAKLASIRLQHELFERRYAIFLSARDFLLQVFKGNFTQQDMGHFLIGTAPAEFLLNRSIVDYFQKIHSNASELQASKLIAARAVSPDESQRQARRETEMMQWFRDQLSELNKHFRPFLTIPSSPTV